MISIGAVDHQAWESQTCCNCLTFRATQAPMIAAHYLPDHVSTWWLKVAARSRLRISQEDFHWNFPELFCRRGLIVVLPSNFIRSLACRPLLFRSYDSRPSFGPAWWMFSYHEGKKRHSIYLIHSLKHQRRHEKWADVQDLSWSTADLALCSLPVFLCLLLIRWLADNTSPRLDFFSILTNRGTSKPITGIRWSGCGTVLMCAIAQCST